MYNNMRIKTIRVNKFFVLVMVCGACAGTVLIFTFLASKYLSSIEEAAAIAPKCNNTTIMVSQTDIALENDGRSDSLKIDTPKDQQKEIGVSEGMSKSWKKKDRKECKDCYIKISMHEEKTDEGIRFSLKDVEIFHNHTLRNRIPSLYRGRGSFHGDYVFETHDEHNKLIEQYCIYSGRFMLWDDFSPNAKIPGGQVEFSSGTIRVILPNNERIYSVRIVKGRRDGPKITTPGPWIIGPNIRCGGIKNNR